MDWPTVWVTCKLALMTTSILLLVGVPFAWWLTHSRFPGRFFLEALVSLPLVLPPTVLGFYLLVATGPKSPLGSAYEQISGSRLPFTFAGILLASVLFNLPFAVRPFMAAFAGVDRRLLEASWSLGVGRMTTFFRIAIPLSWPGVLSGVLLTFAHCVGEFGVVLMVGGNIPGVTRTLSIAIYDDVQALDYASAGATSLWLVLFAFAVLASAQWLGRNRYAVAQSRSI